MKTRGRQDVDRIVVRIVGAVALSIGTIAALALIVIVVIGTVFLFVETWPVSMAALIVVALLAGAYYRFLDGHL